MGFKGRKGPVMTPDGRYIVVRGRLWRAASPALSSKARERATRELMAARRAVKAALATDDEEALGRARTDVHAAKVALGERGPVWWSDGAPDETRRMAKNTRYADWWRSRQQDPPPAPEAEPFSLSQ